MGSTAPERGGRGRIQLTLILGATLVWAWLPWPILGVWVLAYLGAWALLQNPRFQAPGPWVIGALALALLLSAGRLLEQGRATVELEGFSGLTSVLADRFRLDRSVQFAPPVVRDDRPQSFFVTAPGAQKVELRLGAEGPTVTGQDLGEGLFRVDYDPRRDGPPSPPEGRSVLVRVDGVAHPRPAELIQAAPHPRALAWSGSSVLALDLEGDALWRWSPGTAPVPIPVGDGPVGLAVLSSTEAVVSARFDHRLARVDLVAGRVRVARALPSEPGPVVSGGGLIGVGLEDGVAFFRGPELRPAGQLLTRNPPDRMVMSRDGRQLLLSRRGTRDLLRFRREASGTWTQVHAPLRFGRPVVALALASDEQSAAVALTGDPEDGAGGNHAVEDQLLWIGLDTWKIKARVPTAVFDEAGVIGGASPVAIAPGAEGFWVSFAGTDQLGQWRPPAPPTLSPSRLARPQCVVETPFGPVLSSPASARLWGPPPFGDAQLPGPTGPEVEARRRGELSFLESTRSGLSCDSCHLDQDSDGAFHDIGHGTPRPTLSTYGIAGTAPYLRGASYPSLASLDTFAHGVLGGYRSERPDRAEDQDRFLRSLVRGGRAGPVDESLRAGHRVFHSAACAACHRPPAFTDLAQYPSGFLFPDRGTRLELLDTPSLRSLSQTAPYLYDGRAPTLERVFETEDPGQRHGAYFALTPSERTLLFRFLRSL